MLGTPNIMKFLTSCQKPVAVAEVKPKQDDTPKPSSAVAETLEARYARCLKENQAKLNAVVPQPLSNAYKTLNLEGSRALTMSEMKIMENFDQNLKIQRAKAAMPKAAFFHEKLGKALLDTGKYPKDVVNQNMSKIQPDELPAEARDLYFAMLKAGVQARLVRDQNYPSMKGSQLVSALDKLN